MIDGLLSTTSVLSSTSVWSLRSRRAQKTRGEELVTWCSISVLRPGNRYIHLRAIVWKGVNSCTPRVISVVVAPASGEIRTNVVVDCFTVASACLCDCLLNALLPVSLSELSTVPVYVRDGSAWTVWACCHTVL